LNWDIKKRKQSFSCTQGLFSSIDARDESALHKKRRVVVRISSHDVRGYPPPLLTLFKLSPFTGLVVHSTLPIFSQISLVSLTMLSESSTMRTDFLLEVIIALSRRIALPFTCCLIISFYVVVHLLLVLLYLDRQSRRNNS
jgi:hypothetical protein